MTAQRPPTKTCRSVGGRLGNPERRVATDRAPLSRPTLMLGRDRLSVSSASVAASVLIVCVGLAEAEAQRTSAVAKALGGGHRVLVTSTRIP